MWCNGNATEQTGGSTLMGDQFPDRNAHDAPKVTDLPCDHVGCTDAACEGPDGTWCFVHAPSSPESRQASYQEFSFVTWCEPSDVFVVHEVIQRALDAAEIDYGGVIGSIPVDLDGEHNDDLRASS